MTPIRSMRALAVAALALLPAVASAESLVIYTSQPNTDAQQTVDAFKAANPGIEVEWVRDGTTKIMAKLRAEIAAGAPQADVLLIADSVTMAGLKAEGRLLAATDIDVSAYDPALYDKDRTWFSTKLITTGIVYNTNAGIAPKSWKDLVTPEMKDKVAMPSPLTSGAATIHMVTLTADPRLGWAYYEALAANGTQAKGGNGGILKAVAGGEKAAGVIVDFMPIREAQKGAPVAFVFPEEGVSAVTEPVAILSTAKNPAQAKKFVSFLLSPAGQKLAADQGYLPAHPGVQAPEGFPARDRIRLMAFDPADALANDAAYKKRFVDIFGE